MPVDRPFKTLIWPGLLTLVTLVGLVGLGLWQLQRLEWKEDLIARVEARTKAAPITLAKATDLARQGTDPSYIRVRVEGRFHHGKERYLYALSGREPGWTVITPLETAKGEMVLVARGFVPGALQDPATRRPGQIEEIVTVTGLLRAGQEQGAFAPDADLEAKRWFWRDLPGMRRSMFPGATTEIAPFFLEAEASDVPGGWPKGGQTRLEFPNKHLQYALTWFLLAIGLVVIFALYLRSVLREGAD
jgi:surfeit locus 1 family protein